MTVERARGVRRWQQVAARGKPAGRPVAGESSQRGIGITEVVHG